MHCLSFVVILLIVVLMCSQNMNSHVVNTQVQREPREKIDACENAHKNAHKNTHKNAHKNAHENAHKSAHGSIYNQQERLSNFPFSLALLLSATQPNIVFFPRKE